MMCCDLEASNRFVYRLSISSAITSSDMVYIAVTSTNTLPQCKLFNCFKVTVRFLDQTLVVNVRPCLCQQFAYKLYRETF